MAPRPGKCDTPPESPGLGHNGVEEEDMQEMNMMEIIDLDELQEGNESSDDDDPQEGGSGAEGLAVAPEDNSSYIFSKHQKAVFACHFHPRFDLCVTGGEDDKAYVWNWKTGEVVMETPSFKDSVIAAKFNRDGDLLALADMAGNIEVYKVVEGNPNSDPIWSFETSDLTWMDWHHGANVLFAGTDESELWMWKVPGEDSKMYYGNGEKVEGAKLLPDGRKMIVGYGDGSMRLFDLKSGDVLHNVVDNIHGHVPGAVTALDVRSDNNLVASGGADGTAKIFNIHSGKNVATFFHGKEIEGLDQDGQSKSTVEAVLISPPDQNLVVTGTLEGEVCVWDISSQVTRHCVNVGDGVVKMQWRKGTENQILVATLHGKIATFDFRAGKILGECSGHIDAILDFSQTEDGHHVLTASDDGTCRVFNINIALGN